MRCISVFCISISDQMQNVVNQVVICLSESSCKGIYNLLSFPSKSLVKRHKIYH
jgi:hypothetical protein